MSAPQPHPLKVAATDGPVQPFLFWNGMAIGGGGMALACPQCAGANLHLDAIHLATPAADDYSPAIGITIDPDSGAVLGDDKARTLHASENRGPMLSIGYWCEEGCRGRIELRGHKGNLFASLHEEPSSMTEDPGGF